MGRLRWRNRQFSTMHEMITSERVLICSLFALVLQVISLQTHASDLRDSPLEGRLQLRLGAFWPNLDSGLAIELDGQRADRLDLERDLGLDDAKTTIYGGFTWRFAPRHTLELEYFDLGREGDKSAEREWIIGDNTALLGAKIVSEMDLRMARLTYQYAIVSSDRHRFSFLGGIHYMRLEAEIALSGGLLIDDKPIYVKPDKPVSEVDRTEAPLPHFGLQYLYSLGRDWSAHFSVIGFNVDIDNVDGRLLEVNAGAQYRFNSYLGLGAGLKYFDLDVDHERKQKTTEYDFDFFGPAIYLTATF